MSRAIFQMTLGALIALPLAVCAPSADAMGATPATTPVAISCTGAGTTDVHDRICTALQENLTSSFPARTFTRRTGTDGLTIILTVANLSNTAVTAHLAWSGRGSGRTPDITAGIRDADIGARQYDMLTNSLIQKAELPL